MEPRAVDNSSIFVIVFLNPESGRRNSMNIKNKSWLVAILFIACIVLIPLGICTMAYHEEYASTRIDERIRSESVKSITNKFSEAMSFGGAGGLASTEIEVFSAEQFLEKTAGEPVYSSIDYYNFDHGLDKIYVSLIKDRSGVYIYHDRYELADYYVAAFDGRNIYWYKNNESSCTILGLALFLAAALASLKCWDALKRRGTVCSIT